MMSRNRYDRDRPHHRRAAPWGGRNTHDYDRGARYHREYDGGHPRARAYRYTGPEYRHAARHSASLGYEGDFEFNRHHDRPREIETTPDARWATPSHRRRREPRGPWRRAWQPDEWWHAIGPEPRADYDWAYEARRPERYGWTGETGRG